MRSTGYGETSSSRILATRVASATRASSSLTNEETICDVGVITNIPGSVGRFPLIGIRKFEVPTPALPDRGQLSEPSMGRRSCKHLGSPDVSVQPFSAASGDELLALAAASSASILAAGLPALVFAAVLATGALRNGGLRECTDAENESERKIRECALHYAISLSVESVVNSCDSGEAGGLLVSAHKRTEHALRSRNCWFRCQREWTRIPRPRG